MKRLLAGEFPVACGWKSLKLIGECHSRFATFDADRISEEFPLTIHEAYSKECSQPVFLTVDTTLKTSQLRVQAYVEIENQLLSQ